MNNPEIPQDEPTDVSEEPETMQPVEPVDAEAIEPAGAPEPVEPAEPKTTQPPEPAAPEKAPQKRPSFLLRAFRWLLVCVILVGLGAILVLFLLYIPTRDELDTARGDIAAISSQSEADLQDAKQEIERLKAFEPQNEALQQALDLASLRVTVLEIRTDVLSAQLALLNGENEKALLVLSSTDELLNQLSNQVPSELNEFIETLHQRLELAVNGIENDDSAAESDLNVLIIKLLELEDSLFQ